MIIYIILHFSANSNSKIACVEKNGDTGILCPVDGEISTAEADFSFTLTKNYVMIPMYDYVITY